MALPTGGILGLDTGNKTGWAYRPLTASGRPSRRYACGSFRAGWEGCSEIQACGSVSKLVAGKLEEFKPVSVAIEAPILLPRDTVAKVTRLHGIVGAVRTVCYQAGLKQRFYEYHHKTIKRHATGDPHADKEAMMAAGRAMGWEFGTDDDACDALWICSLLITEIFRPIEQAAGKVA